MNRRLKFLIPIAAVALIVVGVVVTGAVFAARSFFSAEDSTYTAVVTTTPAEVNLAFDNTEAQPHSGTETYEFTDEEVHIIADQDEFSGHEETYTLSSDHPTEISIDLTPETADAEATIREETDAYQRQADVTEESLQHAEQLSEDNPVLQLLPHETDTFRAYNGLSETDEFGIHVYLYPQTEDDGREDFADWMDEEGYAVEDYDVIYHLDEEGPPVEADDPPSRDELNTTEAPNVSAHEDTAPSSDDPHEIVQQFLDITNTFDTTEDASPSDALMRAHAFMTDEKADELFEPQNPIVSPKWREAAETDSVSAPWVSAIDATTSSDQITYQARVCWAWIPQGNGDALIDTPRAWTVTLHDTDEGYRVSDFTYQDAYVGDDPQQSSCAAHF